MRILLLNPPLKDRTIARDMAGGLGFEVGKLTILPPLNLALFASLLRANNHQVKILDPPVELINTERLYAEIKAFNAEIIIGNISLPSLTNDSYFLRELKSITKAKTIAKTEINFPPILKEILALANTDLCIFGECEQDIEKVISDSPVPGVAFRREENIEVIPPIFTKNLDALPFLARDLLHNERYHFPPLGAKTTTMQTSRGCPFSCSYYCPYPLVQGKEWRAMSASRVYAELEDIVINYNIPNVLFRDACFTLDKLRVAKICRLILHNNLKLNWWCETRINCLDKDLLSLMKKAGCKGVTIGVETGDAKLLTSQAKEGVNIEDLRNLCKYASMADIRLHLLFLVGLPHEDRNSLYKTFRLIEELKPVSLGVSTITPYPGTPLFYEAKEKGWIETMEWEKYSGDFPVMHTDRLRSQDLQLGQKMLQACSYLSRRQGFLAFAGLKLLEQLFKVWAFLGNRR